VDGTFPAIPMERLVITDDVAAEEIVDEEDADQEQSALTTPGKVVDVCKAVRQCDNIEVSKEIIMHHFHTLRYILRVDIDIRSASIVTDKKDIVL
jgi:hypothetical protein